MRARGIGGVHYCKMFSALLRYRNFHGARKSDRSRATYIRSTLRSVHAVVINTRARAHTYTVLFTCIHCYGYFFARYAIGVIWQCCICRNRYYTSDDTLLRKLTRRARRAKIERKKKHRSPNRYRINVDARIPRCLTIRAPNQQRYSDMHRSVCGTRRATHSSSVGTAKRDAR